MLKHVIFLNPFYTFTFLLLLLMRQIMKNTIYYNKFKMLALLACFGLTFGSCKHKTDFDALPEVSYSANIAPIISSNCAYSGCHGDSARGNISLVSYSGLMSGGIEAGAPNKSKLYNSLKTLGDDIMPKKPYSELTDKQIQLIYVWIGQGAKNN